MTEYGRGTGSEPWHPEDPLYGDQGGWGNGRESAPGGYPQQDESGYPQQHGPWHPYGDQQYPPQHPPYPQQYPEQQPYPQHHTSQQYPGQYPQQNSQYPEHPQYPQYPDYPQQPYPHTQHHGGWENSQGGDPASYRDEPGSWGWDDGGPAAGPADPYGGQQTGQRPNRPGAPRDTGRAPGPDRETGWDPGPDRGEHAFFSDDGNDGPDDGSAPARGGRRGDRERRGGGKKRRSGCACLVVLLVLGGGVGTVGWFGYQFYESRFGPAPDYAGDGHGEVQVEIPKGATLSDMGNILKKAGVVKSHDAFVAAAQQHDQGAGIQAGVYLLRKEMSAAAAVEMMTDPSARNALIIAEGLRTDQVYQAIDEKLGLEEGTTAEVADAEAGRLGLPEWAGGDGIEDPLEGFLFPARYDVGKESKPAEVLGKMVSRAKREYRKQNLQAKAGELNLDSPLEVVTVASLVQAEGKFKADFEKVARVIYNRLEPGNTETNGHLDFDSTYNYAKGQSTLELPSPATLRRFDHPYNTYNRTGLPPGPIANPGAEALAATLDPAEGDWFYFVSITEDQTVFSETYEEHRKNVEKYNQRQDE